MEALEPVGIDALEKALESLDHCLIVRKNDGDDSWLLRQLDVGERFLCEPGDAYIPALNDKDLGDRSFREDHNLTHAYVAGAMANGIASVELVEAMSRAGMLAFFGSAGLTLGEVEKAIDHLAVTLPDSVYGCNLIHSPNEPDLEMAVVDLLLRKNVQLIEASAYLDLTLPVVKYRVHGIYEDANGNVIAPNRIVAKVSRVEVASKFLAPPPDKFLRQLVAQGYLQERQAELARRIPMAQDITAEADSAGHTDNRPALALLPTMLVLRNRLQKENGYDLPLRVGAAGGIATPTAALAAFAMGAAYIVTGSVNQACVESGSSDAVRQMLAETEQADVTMAPAADMFEMGVKLQVLKRGTMFAMRAGKLWEHYRNYKSLDEIPSAERTQLEKMLFRLPLEEVWQQTKDFFLARDPSQIQKAERDSRHKMALVFRWYLGQSSRWANRGVPDRKLDFQVWCGPAMGAFNEWVKGSYLEQPNNRRAADVARNIMFGAALLWRAQTLRNQGIDLPVDRPGLRPRMFH